MSIDPLTTNPLAADATLAPQPQQPRTQKQRSNVYTMMLIVSFAAMVTGSMVLYMHLQQYSTPTSTDPWWKVPAELKTEAAS